MDKKRVIYQVIYRINGERYNHLADFHSRSGADAVVREYRDAGFYAWVETVPKRS